MRNPEGQQAGPRVTDGKGSSPIITSSGRLHKSNLRISAGVSPATSPAEQLDGEELTAPHPTCHSGRVQGNPHGLSGSLRSLAQQLRGPQQPPGLQWNLEAITTRAG